METEDSDMTMKKHQLHRECSSNRQHSDRAIAGRLQLGQKHNEPFVLGRNSEKGSSSMKDRGGARARHSQRAVRGASVSFLP